MMKARILGLFATGTVLALATSGASAQEATKPGQPGISNKAVYQAAVLQVVAPNIADKMGRNLLENPDPERAGSGTEGGTITIHRDEATGEQYLIAVYMASADREKHPKQALMTIRCASFKFQDSGPPTLVADNEVQAEEGRRTAHRPAVPPRTDAKGRFPLTYGNDKNQNSPSAYLKVMDYKCNVLSSPKRVSLPYMTDPAYPGFPGDDANSGGAGYIDMFKDSEGRTRYIGNYLATNGQVDTLGANGMTDDDIFYSYSGYINDANEWVADWKDTPADQMIKYIQTDDNATPPTVTEYLIPAKNNPRPTGVMADIGRGSRMVTVLDDKRYAWCTPYGNNRPSDNIECGVSETSTGNILWRDFILKGDEGTMMKHWNQSTIQALSPTRVAISAISTNGAGKNTNIKGAGTGHLFVFDVAGNALVKVAQTKNAAVHAPHSALCTGMRGMIGEEKATIFVISAAHTGIGRAAGTFVNFDETAKSLLWSDRSDKVPVAWYGDGQYLANLYGDQPMDQGRDFPKCIGDIPNPAFGKEGGWMKETKTFFAAPVHGREPGYSRNAFWVSLVPGVTLTKVDHFSSPANASDAQVAPATNDAPPTPVPAKESSSGCGCSTPGQTNSANFAGGLLLLGLAIGGIAARRRS